MTKFERVQAVLSEQAPDRAPFSFWYHFTDIPQEERAGEKLAVAELDFYRKYDPDLLKVMHDIPYDLPPGVEKLESLDQALVVAPDQGNFGKHLEALRIITGEVGQEVPVVDTIFSCFSYAEKLTGGLTREIMRNNPTDLHAGMKKIATTLADWSEAVVRNGCAGIYYALQGATEGFLSEADYREFFLPYDRIVLERVKNLAMLIVLHLHGEDLHWRLWEALPFNVLSWSSNITPPTIAEGRAHYPGAIIGGVNEVEIGNYTPEQVKAEIRQAILDTDGGRGLIVAPGCAVPTDCPPANLHAFKAAVTEG